MFGLVYFVGLVVLGVVFGWWFVCDWYAAVWFLLRVAIIVQDLLLVWFCSR